MKPQFTLTILLLLVSPIAVCAQFRPGKCEVQPLWAIPGGVRSSNFGLMGTFETDTTGGTYLHSYKLEDTDLIATVGVDFNIDSSKYKLHRVRLAISVSNNEQKEVFESVDSSEAKTLYHKGWNLSVTKNMNFDDRIYMFTLRCWDRAAFGGKIPFL